jgi:hypothetical protein
MSCHFGGEDAMLEVTVHEDGTFCRLEPAGRLAGPWVLETEYAWRSALCSGRQIEVDMRQLTDIDDAGRELLLVMHLAGVRLIVEGLWMKGIVEEITEDRSIDDMGVSRNKSVSRDQRSGSRRSN